MNVYISVDIEGITGLVSWHASEEASSACYDWPFARRMMTHDVNASIRGARNAGADRIVVKDSHGNCKNLLLDELEPGVELISGWNGASDHYMMQGIEEGGFGATFLIGYHAMAGVTHGTMEHAMSGSLHRLWMNGKEVGEMALSAALAGEHGVPLVLVTSDDAGCSEAASQFAGVSTFSVKTGLSRFMSRLRHPSVTGPGIEATAEAAVRGASAVDPFKVKGPVTLRVQFKETNIADLASTLSRATRLDGYTVEVTGANFLEAHRMIGNVFTLGAQGRRLGS